MKYQYNTWVRDSLGKIKPIQTPDIKVAYKHILSALYDNRQVLTKNGKPCIVVTQLEEIIL